MRGSKAKRERERERDRGSLESLTEEFGPVLETAGHDAGVDVVEVIGRESPLLFRVIDLELQALHQQRRDRFHRLVYRP